MKLEAYRPKVPFTRSVCAAMRWRTVWTCVSVNVISELRTHPLMMWTALKSL